MTLEETEEKEGAEFSPSVMKESSASSEPYHDERGEGNVASGAGPTAALIKGIGELASTTLEPIMSYVYRTRSHPPNLLDMHGTDVEAYARGLHELGTTIGTRTLVRIDVATGDAFIDFFEPDKPISTLTMIKSVFTVIGVTVGVPQYPLTLDVDIDIQSSAAQRAMAETRNEDESASGREQDEPVGGES